MDKNFKIWGMSYGIIGDLIMGLPMLTYFEKKYPGSYKYWVIEKKCSVCAPLYFNHPLIDRIKITDEWGGFGEEDRRLMSQCNVLTTHDGWKHNPPDWFNVRSCVEETAMVAGIKDIKEVLTPEEMKPKLYRWFDAGIDNPECHTYSKQHVQNNDAFKKDIAIYPFAIACNDTGRSPSHTWWNYTVEKLLKDGYSVSHYGRSTEPKITDKEGYSCFTHLSYFEQVKRSLASKLVIGTDSGSMWVMGAYSHPAIHLMTNYLTNHSSNFLSLAPVNDNATNLFAKGGACNINNDEVLETVKNKVKL